MTLPGQVGRRHIQLKGKRALYSIVGLREKKVPTKDTRGEGGRLDIRQANETGSGG